MATNKRRKKSKLDFKKVALLSVSVLTVVIAIVFAVSSTDNTPDYEYSPTENIQTNNVEDS